jgi:toxin ParE1/3/4
VSLPLEFHPSVQRDVGASWSWYEQKRPGLGAKFLEAVSFVLGEITDNPAKYGFADADIREGLLTSFPFAVYYRLLSDRIRVLAVYHTSRNPSGWQSRN